MFLPSKQCQPGPWHLKGLGTRQCNWCCDKRWQSQSIWSPREQTEPKGSKPQPPVLLHAVAVLAGSSGANKHWSVSSLCRRTKPCSAGSGAADDSGRVCWSGGLCTLHQFCLLSLKARTNSHSIVMPNLISMVAFHVTRTTMLLLKDAAGFFYTTHGDK